MFEFIHCLVTKITLKLKKAPMYYKWYSLDITAAMLFKSYRTEWISLTELLLALEQ